jgi:hypothetical protein
MQMADYHKESKRIEGDSVVDANRIWLISRPTTDATKTPEVTILAGSITGCGDGLVCVGAGQGVRIVTGAVADNPKDLHGDTKGMDVVVGNTQKIDLQVILPAGTPASEVSMSNSSITLAVGTAVSIKMDATSITLQAGASSITMNDTGITLKGGTGTVTLAPAGVTINGTMVNIN